MKTMKLCLLVFCSVFSCVLCYGSNEANNFNTLVIPPLSPGELVSAVIVLYELVCRVIPTTKNISILHNVISFLEFISGRLNKDKKIN